MADALKNYFNAETVRSLGRDFQKAWPSFDRSRFEALALESFEPLGLTQRGWAVAEAIQTCMPFDFSKAVRIMTKALGPTLETSELKGMEVFRYMPAAFWVSKYGIDHVVPSLEFQYEVTQRFTAEFSIRSFIERHPQTVLPMLKRWAQDKSAHVRRLVSEGSRPRLPWAARLRLMQNRPELGIELLELLKDDPELYVRRSVANHLNDIGKDHPELAVRVAKRWLQDADENRRWIVKHALRDLIKKGHPGALQAMGAGQEPKLRVKLIALDPKKPRIGSQLRFQCRVESRATRRQDLLVDFAVHFVKANGKTAPKIFKLTRLDLPPRANATLSGRVSFKPMTTRKHYPGRHRLDLRINGKDFALTEFWLS